MTQLTDLLNLDWNVAQTDNTFAVTKGDPIKILVSRLYFKVNTSGKSYFVCSTQLDVKKPKSYIWVIQYPHAAQWV